MLSRSILIVVTGALLFACDGADRHLSDASEGKHSSKESYEEDNVPWTYVQFPDATQLRASVSLLLYAGEEIQPRLSLNIAGSAPEGSLLGFSVDLSLARDPIGLLARGYEVNTGEALVYPSGGGSRIRPVRNLTGSLDGDSIDLTVSLGPVSDVLGAATVGDDDVSFIKVVGTLAFGCVYLVPDGDAESGDAFSAMHDSTFASPACRTAREHYGLASLER